jgi:hypothetical protein
MNPIALTGVILSVPRRESIGDLHYTSFGLWIPDKYRNGKAGEYAYAEQYSIICVCELDRFVRGLRRFGQIEVQGQLRGSHQVLCLDWPHWTVPVDISYPRVIASSIRWRDRAVSRAAGDDPLIALDQPEPA